MAFAKNMKLINVKSVDKKVAFYSSKEDPLKDLVRDILFTAILVPCGLGGGLAFLNQGEDWRLWIGVVTLICTFYNLYSLIRLWVTFSVIHKKVGRKYRDHLLVTNELD